MGGGLSLRERVAGLNSTVVRLDTGAKARCEAKLEAAFGPASRRKELRERARFWATQARKPGSVEHLRDLLVRHHAYWRRDAGVYALRTSRLWILTETYKLRAARNLTTGEAA